MKANIYSKEIMDYFYEQNGWLYWKKLWSSACRQKIGSLAGCLDKSTGYYRVGLNGENYLIHRILYQLYHNIILEPNDVIDHIDRDKTNNCKENLEKKTQQKNCLNRNVNKNNLSTGIKNIHILHRDCYDEYYIRITVNNKVGYSKLFRTDKFTEQEVIEIRNRELERLHGDNASFC